jgi:hypothetical protein
MAGIRPDTGQIRRGEKFISSQNGLVSSRLTEDPRSGDLFIFINKPRNRFED